MAPAICSLSGRIRSPSLSPSLQRAEAPTWARGGAREEEEEGVGRQQGRCLEGSTAPRAAAPVGEAPGVMRRAAPVAGRGWH